MTDADSAPVVLTSARREAEPPTAGPAPRIDYVELSAALGARLLYAPRPHVGRVGALESRLGLEARQAIAAARRGGSVFVSFNEGIAMPLAFADRTSTPHLALVHHALRRRTRLFQRTTRFLHRLDRIVVLARAQEHYLRDELGLPPERVRFVYDKVDHRFWTPGGSPSDGSVLAVGTEGRDYRTLVTALAGLDIPVTIVAGSLWVATDRSDLVDLPANVAVTTGLSFEALRTLYERAAVVVVPLRRDLRYAAGVNAVLEAMAMGKALVVSATPGISDYVEDGVTARVVPSDDPSRLRAVVTELLSDAQQRSALAGQARAVVERGRNLDTFVRTLAGIAEELGGGASPRRRRH